MERLQRGALALGAGRDAVAAGDGVEAAEVSVERMLAARPELRRVVEELDALVEEIHALGVELKDVELGLIDFPAVHDGEDVYLCWQFGEDRIRFWHRRSEGFARRRPLPGIPPGPALQ